MNYAVHKISLDIHKPESQVVLNVKQIDTGRKIKISLTEDGRPYVLTSDCLAIFKAKTPDGKDIKMDCAIDGNVIIYTISFQTTATLGEVECEIMLYNESGMIITSPRFVIIVNDKVHSEGSIAEPDSKASTKLEEILKNKTKSAVKEYFEENPIMIERPTAVFEFEGSCDYFTMPDMPGTLQVLVADFYMESNIPIGAEIKSIEFMFDENIGWVDIREMIAIDGIPYILNMARTFDGTNIFGESCTCFAVISYLNEGNFLYEASHAFLDGKIRITYYTDNIGGENNA